MRPFAYERADDLPAANRRRTDHGRVAAPDQFLAGGTTQVDLMKLDVLRPERLVDINPLRARFSAIAAGPEGLRLGAFATMAQAADHRAVRERWPAVAQSLALAASPQLRNMATLGGNLLQRTRCPYYRDTTWEACNKRRPGSGCAAIGGYNRNHAVLGVSDACIAQYPGDLAVALVALDAALELSGDAGLRRIPLAELHSDSRQPDVEHTLRPGEVITAILIPGGPLSAMSRYVKVRDRASYEFAIASAAVALDMDGERVRQARIGLGGMAYRPWRAREAEVYLVGKRLDERIALEAGSIAMHGAAPHEHNAYKPELGRRTVARALLETAALRGQTSGASA